MLNNLLYWTSIQEKCFSAEGSIAGLFLECHLSIAWILLINHESLTLTYSCSQRTLKVKNYSFILFYALLCGSLSLLYTVCLTFSVSGWHILPLQMDFSEFLYLPGSASYPLLPCYCIFISLLNKSEGALGRWQKKSLHGVVIYPVTFPPFF